MKKFVILLAAGLLAVTAVSAQGRNERQRINPPSRQTVEGVLKLEKGSIAIQSGDTIYLVPALTRYIGFIDGLREDARVSVEGFILRNIINPAKVTIGDKSYDFNMPGLGLGVMGFGMMRNNFNNMRNQLPAPGIRERLDRERHDTDRESIRQNRRNRTQQG